MSDASHELRTPLTSVNGYVDLCSQGGFREPGQLDDAMRRITSEANRMTSLIEDLLALARFDEEQPLNRKPLKLSALIGQVISDSSAAHPDRVITADVAAEMPTVSLDQQKVHQLLVGLVDNAVVHAPAATIAISADASDDRVKIVVADDGPGLETHEAERVFERFYRGDPARARTTGGSGLGLSVAHSIVTAHQGTIELVTAPDEGCKFVIRLPPPTRLRRPQHLSSTSSEPIRPREHAKA